MIYKNILVALFMGLCISVSAQVKVLDPDNMQPVQATTTGHEQTLANILPMGNWATNKQLDSLKVGDTLTLTNATAIAEYELNFKKEGKVAWYKQHSDVQRDKMGNNTFSVTNTWDEIGSWIFGDNLLTLFVATKDKAPQKKFALSKVSVSYTKVLLVVNARADVVGN